MTAVTLQNVLDDLTTQLTAIGGLNVFGFEPKSATPPFAFLSPKLVAYDLTMRGGSTRFTIDVIVGYGEVVDRSYWAGMAAAAAPTGFKQAIESSTVFDYRVTQAQFGQVHLAGNEYAGVTFQVDVGA